MRARNALVPVASAVVLAASICAASHAQAMQLANPASVYCRQLGGKHLTVRTRAGIRSDCLLPNGKRIDEWKLYRRDHKRRK